MASESKRPLIKGSLRPLKRNPQGGTHTEVLSSKDEISVRRGNSKHITVTEFSFQSSLPMPFLDPSVMQLRVQAEKLRLAAEEKQKEKEKGEGPSSSSQPSQDAPRGGC